MFVQVQWGWGTEKREDVATSDLVRKMRFRIMPNCGAFYRCGKRVYDWGAPVSVRVPGTGLRLPGSNCRLTPCWLCVPGKIS